MGGVGVANKDTRFSGIFTYMDGAKSLGNLGDDCPYWMDLPGLIDVWEFGN